MKLNWKSIKDGVSSILEKRVLTSVIVLVLLSFVVFGLSYPYYKYEFHAFVGQVLAEAHGMLFDILVIGIFIFWLNETGERRLRIRMYKDEIDDFRLWESEEAAFRTTGNIKRLNRHKIHDINLVNCHLSRTNLSYVNLKESNLNSANLSNSNMIEIHLENSRLNQTNLENAKMNQAILRKAYANGANFKDSFLIKADFEEAFLIKADFENAYLMEANLRGCHLTGANFKNASLYKADLRDTTGLSPEQLSEAKTLYLAQLDPILLKEVKEKFPELLGK